LRSGSALALHPETTLGARPENEIVLGDPFVSGRHARLSWDGSNWWVEDLGSRNGTYVDRRRCSPHTPQVLPPGGVLQVGDITFELLG
jgi:pSer/pThr/pTyr-binding forkhead associated (FHA) protein